MCVEMWDVIQQAEDPQVLTHGEIARQWRIDRRRSSLARSARLRCSFTSTPSMTTEPDVGRQHAEHHVDCRAVLAGLSGPVRPTICPA